MAMNDGIIWICRLQNMAAAGAMPVFKLVPLSSAYFSRQRVGVTRLYAALGVNAQIDAVLRLWNVPIGMELSAMPKDLYAVYSPSDGAVADDVVQYRITLIQEVVGRDAVDITVEKVDQLYDIATE